jgi:hypothetical protein
VCFVPTRGGRASGLTASTAMTGGPARGRQKTASRNVWVRLAGSATNRRRHPPETKESAPGPEAGLVTEGDVKPGRPCARIDAPMRCQGPEMTFPGFFGGLWGKCLELVAGLRTRQIDPRTTRTASADSEVRPGPQARPYAHTTAKPRKQGRSTYPHPPCRFRTSRRWALEQDAGRADRPVLSAAR